MYYARRPRQGGRCYVCCLPIPLLASAIVALAAMILRRRPVLSSAGR